MGTLRSIGGPTMFNCAANRSTFLLLLAAMLPNSAYADDFVHARGTEFVVNEVPVRYVGVNAAVMHGANARAHVTEVLDAAVADGARLIRIWALGEYPSDAPPWTNDYAFSRLGRNESQQAERTAAESSLEHLDRVLDEARTRDLRVIIVLANRWADFGGIPAYLHALRGEAPTERTDPNSVDLDMFLRNPGARSLYASHVRDVVSRTNRRNGLRYADDPTIFSYELVNEMSVPASNSAAYVEWVDFAATEIRALDSNHMISAGHIGYSTERDRETWRASCSRPLIAYCDHHAYPLETGRALAPRALASWIEDRMRIARELDKPLVFGEFGFTTRFPRIQGASGASWLRRFLRDGFQAGMSAALLWSYQFPVDLEHEHRIGVENPLAHRQLRRAMHITSQNIPPRNTRASRAPARDAWSSRWRQQQRVVHRSSRFSVAAFSRIDLDGAGFYARGDQPHLHGLGPGFVEYQLRTGSFHRATLRFVASAEVPGVAGSADETAQLRVLFDGHEVGSVALPPDDGHGQTLQLELPESGVGTHSLRFEVVAGIGVESFCLYDRDGEPGIAVELTR